MPSVKAPATKGIRYHVAGEVLENTDLQSLTGSRWLNDKVCIARALCKRNHDYLIIKVLSSCHGTPFHSYGVSLAIWDHTVLSSTQHK